MRPFLLGVAVAVLIANTPDTGAQPPKKEDPKAKADPKAKDEPKPEFTLKLKTSDIRLGKHISGPKIATADLKGKVVIMDFWGVNCGPCLAAMPGTAALNAELADFGLVVVGAHAQASTPETIKSVAAGRGANFPIFDACGVTGADDFQFIPHVMVFDHTGACIFRGRPAEAEHKARIAVGEMLVAHAGREKLATQLNSAAADLKKGMSPQLVLPKVAGLTANKDAGEDAKALLASMVAVGQKKFDLAKEKAEKDPVEAYFLVEKLPTAFKGAPLAKDAAALLTKLKQDKAVKAEIAARPSLDAVKQFETALAALPGGDKPTAPDFQKANAGALAQLKQKVAQMKKSWPDAKATAEAIAIATQYNAAP